MGGTPRKPWEELSELERRRHRRELERDFLEAGYSPADARELTLIAERWADELIGQTIAEGAR